MNWFTFKVRLSYREWSKAVDRGSLTEIRAWLRKAEQKVMESMSGRYP